MVAERRSKLGGPPVEDLGSYNPFNKADTINKERVKYWLGVGAKPSVTTHNLLVSRGIIEGEKAKVKIRPKKGDGKGEKASEEKMSPNVVNKEESSDSPPEGEGKIEGEGKKTEELKPETKEGVTMEEKIIKDEEGGAPEKDQEGKKE